MKLRQFVGASLVAFVVAFGVARIVVSDGIWDALCAAVERDSALWILYGCDVRPGSFQR